MYQQYKPENRPLQSPFNTLRANSVAITYIQGPKVEILGNKSMTYKIQFIDPTDDSIVWEDTIKNGCWTKCNRQWYTDWNIKAYEKFAVNDVLLVNEHFNPIGKRVYIHLDSSSLGDTIAWFPYVVEYANIHNCTVVCSTFWNSMFKPMYPSIEFVEPSTVVNNLYAMYVIGWWDKDGQDGHLRPSNPRTKPLQQTCSDILGIPYREIKPSLYVKDSSRIIDDNYVCISTFSTAGAKFWLKENGWQEVVDYLNSLGYKVVVTQKEPTQLKNVIDMTGNHPIDRAINLISNCEFFIGLASGLAWVAWALNKKVVMIAGFTEEYTEFHENHFRVINKNVCNGCWNDPSSYPFDKGDWNWCPRLKDTPRHFECSKQILTSDVIRVIENVRATL